MILALVRGAWLSLSPPLPAILPGVGLLSQPVVGNKDTTYEAMYRMPCDSLTVKPCACARQCAALTNITFTVDTPCVSTPSPIHLRCRVWHRVASSTSTFTVDTCRYASPAWVVRGLASGFEGVSVGAVARRQTVIC